jgi:primosomal protein N' (replication factor Y) (superfamily II helicase)
MRVVRVGLDVPVDKLFDYRCDAEVEIGARVLVSFGKRNNVGVVLEIRSSSDQDPARLKSVMRVLRDAPSFSADDLKLLRFASEYYHHPLGTTVFGALPAQLRRVNSGLGTKFMHYALTEAGAAASLECLAPRALVKRRVLSHFQREHTLDARAARDIAATASVALKAFLACGWIALREGTPPQRPVDYAVAPERAEAPSLTEEQNAAVAQIGALLNAFSPCLLLGVTGSGKTEVYLHVIEHVLRAGRQVLLLVPEIALTPQLESMVRGRFPRTTLVSLHSGLNESERLHNWLAAQSGVARIVLGTRLAVFAPLPQLGIIIIDEEHDASFKQNEGFRYSARDLAVVRARQNSIPIVLGSATPALETWHNAATGRYALIELRQRINGPMPRITCVPTRGVKLGGGLAPAVFAALERSLARGEQSLVFINRRGYAPVLMCHDCGWLVGCHRCSAKLVFHLQDRRLHCHHCGYQAKTPEACPSCGNSALATVGQGTQRIEETLTARFPQARILRIDRDSTRKRGTWAGMRERIAAREVDILVGTQILAKGHDFPHLNLVSVVNADSLLYSTDFRAPERLYAILTQVAGRAGRGDTRGDVLIQTEFPQHPIYAALRDQDYRRFADDLLIERRSAQFPPLMFQALIRAEADKLGVAIDWLTRAAQLGRDTGDPVTIYEPVPAAMARLAGRERAQLLVQCSSRQILQSFLSKWHKQLAAQRSSRARWSIDVDPLEL